MFRIALVFALPLLVSASPVQAQRTVAYDTVSMSTPAAVSCGFCAMEKFGVVFYELPTPGGLAPGDFPLTLQAIQVAVARARVVGDILSGYMCQGSAMGGMVSFGLEVYAGETVPASAIRGLPVDGPWPGETEVFSSASVPLDVSVATMDGGRMYNAMINEFALPGGGVRVDPPNTYLRVVFRIPTGGSSMSCSDLGLGGPLAVAIRDDDGRIAPKRSLIYAVPVTIGGIPAVEGGWHWNESMGISDPGSGTSGIGGDWLVRLKVVPIGTPPPVDAGPATMPDAGPMTMPDAGPMTMPDAGPMTMPDGGEGMPGCSVDADCGGGERCDSGSCVRVSCATVADCGGGRTCVGGRCRNLCGSDADCMGGEVCDRASGACAPAGSGGDGGCGCAVAGAPSRGAMAALFLLGLGLLLRRRRRARAAP